MLGVNVLPTISGSTVISHEQLVPGGYLLSGQLGVMISPWAFVIFPPQNCWSETSCTQWRKITVVKKYAKYRFFFTDFSLITFLLLRLELLIICYSTPTMQVIWKLKISVAHLRAGIFNLAMNVDGIKSSSLCKLRGKAWNLGPCVYADKWAPISHFYMYK